MSAFAVLAQPRRRRIPDVLFDGVPSAQNSAARLGISRPAVSDLDAKEQQQ
ncbi:hypothetical protein AB0L06_08115 [Spirillospora sp. NPDC052269]